MINTNLQNLKIPIPYILEDELQDKFQELLIAKNALSDFIKNDNNAAGLAANQLNINLPIISFRLGKNIENIINPIITTTGVAETVGSESCLSLPGVVTNVIRHDLITVSGWRISFKGELIRFSRCFEGMTARIIQHEIDHLNGILILDSAVTFDKNNLKENLPIIKINLEEKYDYIIGDNDTTMIYKIKPNKEQNSGNCIGYFLTTLN